MIELMHHLKEVEARRLFSKFKLPSIIEYMARELGYSEDQAYLRNAAMQMIKQLPQVEEMIRDGRLNLTNIAKARGLFTRKAKEGRHYSRAEKLELFESLSGKSTRDADKIIATIDPQALKYDKVRQVTADMVHFSFDARVATNEKVKRVKALYAHTHPNMSMDELLDMLCDVAIEQKFATSRKSSRQDPDSKAGVLRAVAERDMHKCVNCGSEFAPEFDHIIPKGKGGEDTFENLRLLCRNCNQRAAIVAYGLEKMEKFLRQAGVELPAGGQDFVPLRRPDSRGDPVPIKDFLEGQDLGS